MVSKVVWVFIVGLLFVACSDESGSDTHCGTGTVLQGDTCVVAGGSAAEDAGPHDSQAGADSVPSGGSGAAAAGTAGMEPGQAGDGGGSRDTTEGGSPALGGGGGEPSSEPGSAGAGGTGGEPDDAIVTDPLDCAGRDVTGATVVTDPITQDTTWSGVVHLPNGVSVRNEPTVTIQPGTKIIVGTGATVEFGFQGAHVTVKAMGTAEKPIRFCGETSTPGYYQGVVLRSGVTAASILRNVLIADGGTGTGGALTLEAPVTIQGVQVRNSGAYGVLASGFGVDSSTLIVAGAAKSSVLATASPGLGVPLGSVLTGNKVDAIDVGFKTFDADVVMHALGVPYRVLVDTQSSASTPSVTIEPGVEVRVQAHKFMRFGAAAVSAIGTAEKPILFRGLSCNEYPALECDFEPMAWGPGGQVSFSGSKTIDLEHVEFRRFGFTVEYSSVTKYYYGAVDILSTMPAKLKNVTITSPVNWGVKFLNDGGFSADSSGIVGTGDQYNSAPTLDVDCGALRTLPADTVPSSGGTRVSCSSTSKPLAWPTAGGPFRMEDGFEVYSGGQLTLPAGTKIFFDSDGIAVKNGGSFSAIGSSASPVLLSGSVWTGLYFDTGSSVTLDYVTVTGGGQQVYANQYGANIVTRVPITLTNSVISNSLHWGLKKSAADTTDYTVGNTFSNNTSGDVTNLP